MVATLCTTQQAFAECKTVMGGCTVEQTVNVAPHMRSENNKPANNAKPTVAPANKNIKNTNASASQTATTKKL